MVNYTRYQKFFLTLPTLTLSPRWGVGDTRNEFLANVIN